MKMAKKAVAFFLAAVMGLNAGVFLEPQRAAALTYSDWTYEIKNDGTVEIRKYVGRQKNLTVPGMIDGRTVTSIGDSAFSDGRALRSITISEGVTEIKNNAFFNNKELSWVTLPDSLETIEYSAFYNCKKLTHILIPENVTYIGYEAFGGTSRLMTVYFISPIQPDIGTSSMPTSEQGNAFWGMPAGARAVVPNETNLNTNYTINPLTGTWNNLLVYTEEQFGIDYSAQPVIVPANALDGNLKPGFNINLSNETLTVPPGYTIRSYSLDGGLKWKPMKPEIFNHAKFPILLNKGMTLCLSDSTINPVTKQPFDNLNVVHFPLIKERPRTPQYNVNYRIRADVTGATAGRWVLSEPLLLRDRTGETEFTGNIEIGLSLGAKIVDNKSFGSMPYGGIPILTYREFGYRAVKTSYLIRVPPQTAVQAGTPGYTYTPASKPRRLNVLNELKPPKYIINQKKQILRLMGNDTIYRGSERHLSESPLPPIPAPFQTPPNLVDLPLFESWYNPVNTRVDASTAEFIGGLTVWKAAMINRPASAKQLLTTPPGTPPDDIPADLATVQIGGSPIISGNITVPFTSPFPNLTVTLTNDGFKSMTTGYDVSGWFTNKPNGLRARIVGIVTAGDTSVTVEFHGTPTSLSSSVIALTVAATDVVSGTHPTTIPDPDAVVTPRYSITDRRATFATSTVVSGRKNELLPSAADNITINLVGDNFNAMSVGDDVTSWFTNRPTGLQARVAAAVTAGATSVTVEFYGTPTIQSSAYITATIPASALQGDVLTVSQQYNARWRIWNITLPPVVGGIAGTPMPSGIGTELVITLQLEGDSFVSHFGSSGWIIPPPGISLTTKVESNYFIVFVISGTPTSTGTTVMQVNIPGSALSSGRPITLNDPGFSFVIS